MRFRWHDKARLFGPHGAETEPVPAHFDPEGPLLAIRETPVGEAVARAMAAAESGRGFCLHPEGQAPVGEARAETLECLSSGTSGVPKRVVRHQDSWLASHRVNADLFGIGPGTVCAALGAASHSLTLYAAVEALCLGAEMHLLAGLRPVGQAARLAEAEVTMLNATPTQLRMLAEAGRPLPALRLVLIGGGALDRATRAAVAEMAPNARIRVYYGASETSFIALSDDDTPEGAVGRPYPGVEIAVRDALGRELPEGDTGEIWVRSPYLFDGYGSEGGGDTRWQDGWLTVGELGRVDFGQLTLAGRRSRMFTVADRNLFPEALEAVILRLPGVARAAVLPLPDRSRGQVPVALVQGGPGEDAIRAACRQAMGAELSPRRVLELDDWPLLPSGKTDLRALERLL